MVASIVKASVLALACVSSVNAAEYTLAASDTFNGSTFFDNWNFITANDLNGGFVDYLSQSAAAARSLIGYNVAKARSFIGVDTTTVYSTVQTPTNRGRASLRLESKKTYTKGLFVADLFHVPEEACGIWPAFWTVNETNYPRWGEIDIYENINQQTQSLNVLHTSPGCTLAGNQGASRMTGTVNSYDCNDLSTTGLYGTSQSVNQGCASTNTAPGNYGKAFNARGGGVIVMEWSTHWIKMWNFAPNAVPATITAGKPDTSTFGLPAFTTEGGSCVMDDHFSSHKIIFDTTFCGFYAGQDYFWQQTTCYKSNPTLYSTCAAFVAANPSAFLNSYWIINSLKIYQWQF